MDLETIPKHLVAASCPLPDISHDQRMGLQQDLCWMLELEHWNSQGLEL